MYLNCDFCLLQRFRNQFADENNTTKVSALHITAINVTPCNVRWQIIERKYFVQSCSINDTINLKMKEQIPCIYLYTE